MSFSTILSFIAYTKLIQYIQNQTFDIIQADVGRSILALSTIYPS